MPPARPVARTRAAALETDENSTTSRLTRAKAAKLTGDDIVATTKGAMQTKRAGMNTNTTVGTRQRAALGDVSNVGKGERLEGKKPVKAGLVSKAAQPTGIQKKTTRPASRSTVASKEVKKAEVKRTGPGAIGPTQKSKTITATRESSLIKEDADHAAQQKIETERRSEKEPIVDKENSVAVTAKVEQKVKVEVEQEQLQPEIAQIRDLDSEDYDDPLMVAEYATEIFDYLREIELTSIPNPDYMDHQDDLEWKTRGILIDWLVEVHTRFHLLPETLFLTVNIIDRFLSEKVVPLDRLQLVGITAMFIASKYEEVMSPHVENFRKIADNGFSEAEILSAERFILTTLNYDLSYPNPMNFLRRVSKADNYDVQSRTIGKYLMEISLLDQRFMRFPPSQIAAGAMYLARLMLDRGEWDATLQYYAGYSEEEVEPVVALMVDYLARPICHEAFFKKYASKKFLKASIHARSWAKKSAYVWGLTDLDLSLDQIS